MVLFFADEVTDKARYTQIPLSRNSTNSQVFRHVLLTYSLTHLLTHSLTQIQIQIQIQIRLPIGGLSQNYQKPSTLNKYDNCVWGFIACEYKLGNTKIEVHQSQ